MLKHLNSAIRLLKGIYIVNLTNYRDELAQKTTPQHWLNLPHSVLPPLLPSHAAPIWVPFSDPLLLWRLHTAAFLREGLYWPLLSSPSWKPPLFSLHSRADPTSIIHNYLLVRETTPSVTTNSLGRGVWHGLKVCIDMKDLLSSDDDSLMYQ